MKFSKIFSHNFSVMYNSATIVASEFLSADYYQQVDDFFDGFSVDDIAQSYNDCVADSGPDFYKSALWLAGGLALAWQTHKDLVLQHIDNDLASAYLRIKKVFDRYQGKLGYPDGRDKLILLAVATHCSYRIQRQELPKPCAEVCANLVGVNVHNDGMLIKLKLRAWPRLDEDSNISSNLLLFPGEQALFIPHDPQTTGEAWNAAVQYWENRFRDSKQEMPRLQIAYDYFPPRNWGVKYLQDTSYGAMFAVALGRILADKLLPQDQSA